MTIAAIRRALDACGLILRGGFHPTEDDGAPPGTGTILMAGNAGPALWRAFEAAREPGPDPLNAWTRRVLDPIAEHCGAAALYPFDGPPYYPFLAWAKRAEAVYDSPIGMAIHPEYGLWHAWRGALAFRDILDLPPRGDRPSPCASCADKPCLSSCPVDAFAGGAYDTVVCAAYLRTPDGRDCLSLGCRARRACPVGRDYRYPPAQALLHMRAFLDGQGDVAVRPYRRDDAPAVVALFYDSVQRATAGEYTPAQRRAWAPDVPDAGEWHRRMAARDTVVAERGGQIVGFAELEPRGHVHMFYVHADCQGIGIGARLYRRVEALARGHGCARLTADVSLTARPFFERQGFAVEQAQRVMRRGVALTNFAMAKRLTG